jgi:hypothetical protein
MQNTVIVWPIKAKNPSPATSSTFTSFFILSPC